MKTFSSALLTVALSAAPLWAAPQLIPQPVNMTLGTGTFALTSNTILVAKSADEKREAQQFAASIAPATGFNMRVLEKATKAPAIVFHLDPNAAKSDEGYRLSVTPQVVTIAAPAAAGLFYATQTMRQLLPPQVFADRKQNGVNWQMPAVQIEDAPRFGWRGLHLDTGRFFFPVADVKKYIDVMATQKFNTFHWHLTEDHPDFSPSWVTASWSFSAPYAQPIVTTDYKDHIPPFDTPIPGLYEASMFQVYPHDRGQNYSVLLAEELTTKLLAER